MLVWINNNYDAIVTLCSIIAVLATIGPAVIYFCIDNYHTPTIKKCLIAGFLISTALVLSGIALGNIPSYFGKALKGEYGQKWVTTTKFEANKSPKQLQKILKNNDGVNYFATDDIRVWHRGIEYSGINIKSKEGNNDKVVFSYLEPTMKGIKVNKNKAYIYIYHKKAKPQPKVFKYGEE